MNDKAHLLTCWVSLELTGRFVNFSLGLESRRPGDLAMPPFCRFSTLPCGLISTGSVIDREGSLSIGSLNILSSILFPSWTNSSINAESTWSAGKSGSSLPMSGISGNTIARVNVMFENSRKSKRLRVSILQILPGRQAAARLPFKTARSFQCGKLKVSAPRILKQRESAGREML